MLPAPLRKDSAKRFERGLHFVPRVDVARLCRDDDAVRERFAGFFGAPQTSEKLAELIVAGHVFRMLFAQLLEVAEGRLVVSELDAFERQAVARKGIGGPFGDELLEEFAARLLCLGHRMKARIIAASTGRAQKANAQERK